MSRPSYAPRLLGMPLGALPTTLNATNSQNSADSAPVGPRGAGRVLGRGGRRWGGTRFPRDRGVLLVARWPGQVLWEICTIARIFRTKRACGAFRSVGLSLLFSPLLSLSLSPPSLPPFPPPFLPSSYYYFFFFFFFARLAAAVARRFRPEPGHGTQEVYLTNAASARRAHPASDGLL